MTASMEPENQPSLMLDTNVLMGYLREGVHGGAGTITGALARLLDLGWSQFICEQNLHETYSVATRPVSANGWGMEPPEAMRTLERLQAKFGTLPNHPDTYGIWSRLVELHSVRGRVSHDARLAALALSHRVTYLLTLNPSDFKRFSELTVLTPQDVLKGLHEKLPLRPQGD